MHFQDFALTVRDPDQLESLQTQRLGPSFELTTQNLDHLWLVSSVARDLGIVEKLDIRLPVSAEKGAIVTMGERVLGMILTSKCQTKAASVRHNK